MGAVGCTVRLTRPASSSARRSREWGQAPWLESVYKADIHFDGLENLETWYERMRARPAVRTSLHREGLS